MHVTLSRAHTRSLTVLLVTLVVALAAATATPTARGTTTQTWTYNEGMAAPQPFSFGTPLDPLLTVNLDGSLAFQVTDAAVAAAVAAAAGGPVPQFVVSATTPQIPRAKLGPNARKDFLTLGGALTTVRGVSVSFWYNIDGHTGADGAPVWNLAGNGSPEAFTLQLPAYTGGHTIAYRVQFTAAPVAMTAPVVLSDVVIVYGPYVKPPKGNGNSGGTGNNKDKSGTDKGKPAANTGRGSGVGAGAGSGVGNGSGKSGSGTSGSGGSRSTSSTTGAGSHKAPVHKASTPARSAQAVTDAPVTSAAAAGSQVVAGYAVVASAASAALGGAASAVAPGSAAAGGGQSAGSGMALGFGGTYLAFGAAILGLLLLPIPFVARRLRRVAGYDHEAADAGSWRGDASR